MPYPDRSDLADSLVRMLADAQGEVNVREDRIIERLADEYELTQDEREAQYDSGLNRWEQTVFMLRQHLIKKGILMKGTRRGYWALTPKGMERGLELLNDYAARQDQPSSSPRLAEAGEESPFSDDPTPEYLRIDDSGVGSDDEVGHYGSAQHIEPSQEEDAGANGLEDEGELSSVDEDDDPLCALSALEALGFEVRRAEVGPLHELRSPLSGVTFEAAVLVVEAMGRAVFRVPSKPLLIIASGHSDDNWSLGVIPEGTMIVSRTDLDALCKAHQELPFGLDEIVAAFAATADEQGEGAVQDLIEGRGCSARSIELARILLEHGQMRAHHGEESPIRAEQVYWFLFAQPEYRGRYSQDEIERILSTLSSPAVGAFRGTESGYVQVMTPEIAARRLAALGSFLPT